MNTRQASQAQAIHPLLVVAVFTARLRKRSEIVAVFTAKCWELLACGFHRQCTRVGFRKETAQQQEEPRSLQALAGHKIQAQCRKILPTLKGRRRATRNGALA